MQTGLRIEPTVCARSAVCRLGFDPGVKQHKKQTNVTKLIKIQKQYSDPNIRDPNEMQVICRPPSAVGN